MSERDEGLARRLAMFCVGEGATTLAGWTRVFVEMSGSARKLKWPVRQSTAGTNS